MIKSYERPFDLLNDLKGKNVILHCRAYKEYELQCVLLSYDLHLNLVVRVNTGKREYDQFIKGESVLSIQENK